MSTVFCQILFKVGSLATQISAAPLAPAWMTPTTKLIPSKINFNPSKTPLTTPQKSLKAVDISLIISGLVSKYLVKLVIPSNNSLKPPATNS